MTEEWRIALAQSFQELKEKDRKREERRLRREAKTELQTDLISQHVIPVYQPPTMTKIRPPFPQLRPPSPPLRPPLPQLESPLPRSRPTISARIEDYTNSVCLLHTLTALTPYYLEVLISIEDFERAVLHRWLIRYGPGIREPRVVQTETSMYLHRFVTDAPKGMVVDHQFHNTLDNRRNSLRVCTTLQNNLNRRAKRNASSKFKGVSLCKKSGKWKVFCGKDRRVIYLGGYDSELEAAIVYNQHVAKLHGSMAFQNSIE